ncbi:hypothetical protein AWV80_16530 [Cupriavidus sp. UYMU48A]|nr:hypothetical protein AWV80_16530 [Cupriavidus sp. UYMU48A]
MTPTEFTNRYVPTLEPLERLRSAFLDAVIAHFGANRQHALRVLATAGGATALILLVLGYLLVFAQRAVFLPLLHARDAIIALAEGASYPAFAMTAAGCEMRRLFDALDILRRKLRERASLTEQLEYQALTDSLTGLLNRRALERVAAQPSDPSGPATTSLILMDIDRFKQINDRHGHPVGDAVLRTVADLMRVPAMRWPDSAARSSRCWCPAPTSKRPCRWRTRCAPPFAPSRFGCPMAPACP